MSEDRPLPAFDLSVDYHSVLSFLAVVREGSFAKAALHLGLSRSGVSRSIQRLEQMLGTRLLVRTTRNVAMTPEGELFHELCKPGVDRISDAVVQLRDLQRDPPTGRLRISSTVGFGRAVVAPLLIEFCQLYPTIELDFVLDDRVTDFAKDGFDVAVRNGRLEDSEIIARKLASMQMVVCGSPDYFAQHPAPRSIDELAAHRCVNFRFAGGGLFEWEFDVEGVRRTFLPPNGLTFNDPELVRDAVIAGAGIAQMAGYQVVEGIRSGALQVCLPDLLVQDRGHYLCYASRRHVPPRISVFVDFLLQRFGQIDLSVVPEAAR